MMARTRARKICPVNDSFEIFNFILSELKIEFVSIEITKCAAKLQKKLRVAKEMVKIIAVCQVF